jgi:hypothetical protein
MTIQPAVTAMAFVVARSAPFFVQTQPPTPIIVDIVETDTEISGLADVLIGALGFTGLLMLGAILAAGIFAGVLFWVRSRAGE